MMRAVGLAAVLGFLGGCATLQGALGDVETPHLTFQSAALTQLSPQSATVQLTYQLQNPYPVELPISEADYQVELAGRPLVNGNTPRGIRVSPNGNAPVLITAHATFTDLALVAGAFGRTTARYRVQGHVAVDTPAGRVQLPFSNEGELDMRAAASALSMRYTSGPAWVSSASR